MLGRMAFRELRTCWLGTLPWDEALSTQESVRDARQADAIEDTVLLLEHPPTVTLGRRSEPGEIHGSRSNLEELGVAVHEADRGGKATAHEAGQLVGYPVMRVEDVHGFVRKLENAIIEALGESGVRAGTRDGLTGVWCGERKIASIGIHVQRGVATHGFSINCENDLSTFSLITACGIPGVQMTSVALEGGESCTDCMRKRVGFALARQFGRRQRIVSPARLVPVATGLTANSRQAVLSA